MSEESTLLNRLAAEFLGTAILVATVVGSGIMATQLTKDVALQLLANTIPTGAILVVIITIFGPISGAHFNPIVSTMFALRGDFPKAQVLPFMAAQFLGGILGTTVAHLMFGFAPLVIGTTARTGASLWFSEMVATFTLLIAIIGSIRAKPESVPMIVGLTITATYWFTSSTSFANPAVTLARGFTTSFSGIDLGHVPMFWVAQIIGMMVAALACQVVFPAKSSSQV
jgi:glycerol uptake facilitator-like aquaporin